MSDSRDTNHDGKVSLMEKVKDKLHLGHKGKDTEYTSTHNTSTATHHTAGARDLNHDGHISATEKLASTTMPLSGARDLNHDGRISTTEKLAGAHSSGFAQSGLDSRDLNRDGHISTTEKLASGSHASGFNSTGFSDSRDLNRDGHISTSEKLQTGAFAGSDSRDLNRDGHISASERLGTSHTGLREHDEARLRLHEEQLAISKREVGAGEVGIHKRVMEEHVQQTIPVKREEVTVERRALHGAAEHGARIAAQDEVIRVPLVREEVVTEKRIVPTEEVIVRKKEITENQAVGGTLRSEYVETMQTGATHDSRDLNRDGHVSMGEKLKSTGTNGGALDSRDLNRDGHVSMGEKLKSTGTNGGALDSRDLNRDGHVSMGEKMNYDANRDGHVSAAEKLKGAAGLNQPRAARG